jgi:hypothetical protein
MNTKLYIVVIEERDTDSKYKEGGRRNGELNGRVTVAGHMTNRRSYFAQLTEKETTLLRLKGYSVTERTCLA